MLKRGNKVYTQIVKNCSVSELLPIIQGKADADAVIYSDGFKTYDGLVNYGYKKHYRVKHGENEFETDTTILMVSKTSGDFVKSDSQSSEGYTNTHSIYT
jgi:transposase-like protein